MWMRGPGGAGAKKQTQKCLAKGRRDDGRGKYLFGPGLFQPLVAPNKNGLQTRFWLGLLCYFVTRERVLFASLCELIKKGFTISAQRSPRGLGFPLPKEKVFIYFNVISPRSWGALGVMAKFVLSTVPA